MLGHSMAVQRPVLEKIGTRSDVELTHSMGMDANIYGLRLSIAVHKQEEQRALTLSPE
jgi:hypothetical protein